MNDPVEDFIRDAFEDNHEHLRQESGRGITPQLKAFALYQVLFYWRKLRTVAESITETEVKLHLPNQKTPTGRPFSIEGIVDIVRDNDRVIMYDIKTHEADYVRTHPEEYEQQLNVYAHIWHHLRGRQLDQTAIVATDYPPSVREALASHDPAALEAALDHWDPLVVLPFSSDRVHAMIEKFASVVDQIEDNEFAPTPIEKLLRYLGRGDKRVFADSICRFCDARFSCSSYSQYQDRAAGGRSSKASKDYYNDLGPEAERDEWTTRALAAAPEAATLADII